MSFDLIQTTINNGTDEINKIDGIYLSLRSDLKGSQMTTIIPAKGRGNQLRKTVEFLIDSANAVENFNSSIIVVEISANMEHLQLCREKSCSYVWIHENTPRFNKCLAHNVGYCFTDSPILHFHDSDILVNLNFHQNVKLRNPDSLTALHALREKYVRNLSEGDSNRLFDGVDIKEIVSETYPPIPEEFSRRAPGGSIIVGRSLFELVGGFDPHLFTGYSVEDQFFWDKLSSIVEIQSMNENDLIHIWHDAERSHNDSEHTNPLTAFLHLESKGKYFTLAKVLLEELKRKIHELQGL
jgi:hypothetical protein